MRVPYRVVGLVVGPKGESLSWMFTWSVYFRSRYENKRNKNITDCIDIDTFYPLESLKNKHFLFVLFPALRYRVFDILWFLQSDWSFTAVYLKIKPQTILKNSDEGSEKSKCCLFFNIYFYRFMAPFQDICFKRFLSSDWILVFCSSARWVIRAAHS